MQSGAIRERLKAAFRMTNLVSGLVLLVVVVSAGFAVVQNRALQDQQLRGTVNRQVSILRARLEGNINGNMQLVRGLVANLATEPWMSEERFSAIASQLFAQHGQLRNVAAAPNLKVTLLYPVEGNEKLLGLDYNTLPAQKTAIFRARDTHDLILAGPVDLVQGGVGFVGRFPVFTRDVDGKSVFWGVVSAVVDANKLYADSGLSDPDLDLDIVIRGNDGAGAIGPVFYGDAAVLADRPVLADVTLPTGTWQIAARPKGGWQAAVPAQFPFLVGIFIALALVLIPLFVARHLVEERQRNIAVLRQREQELAALSRRLGLALETSEVGVWEFNFGTDTAFWDDRQNDLFGLPRDGAPRTDDQWSATVHPDDLPRVRAEIDAAVKSRGRYVTEYRIRRPDGEERVVRAIASCYRAADGTDRLVGCNWDVTADVAIRRDLERARAVAEARNAELVEATARIEHTSLHDALTGLPNRRYLDRILSERGTEERGGIALLHIDLDRFKQINDTLGHAAGDAMLVHAARILRANVREDDFVARIGGDEFVVVSPLRNGRRQLTRLANRIIAEMHEPMPYQGHECRCGVSVGIAYQRGKVDGKRLLIDADIALYRAKRRGRNRHEFFTEALQAEIVSTKHMADDILNGLERGEFVAWYQPQFDARTRKISGVEALARWEHPTRGVVPPDLFMPIAEELNVVATIDRMILEQTLSWMRVWRAQGLVVPRASVNVSGRRLRDDALIKSLKKLDIEPGTISFELVESIYLDESDEAVAWNIDQIRELGVDIEMDDFGTGYASIVSLLKLRPRRLKIDRQLIMPVVDSEAQCQLIASIVDIGHSLGIAVVAEGVETLDHARIVTALGCDTLQGYAFSKPLRPNLIERFIAKHQADSAAA